MQKPVPHTATCTSELSTTSNPALFVPENKSSTGTWRFRHGHPPGEQRKGPSAQIKFGIPSQ
eukprot:3518262-Rhodomonas_salina.3